MSRFTCIGVMGVSFLFGAVVRAQAAPDAVRVCAWPDDGTVTTLLASPDCRHVAMVIQHKELEESVRVDDRVVARESHIGGLSISDDWTSVAYAANEENRWKVVVDGKTFGPYEALQERAFFPRANLYHSSDGKRAAFIAKRGNAIFLVVDGKEEPPQARIRSFSFSPDSKHWLYIAGDKDSQAQDRVIVDGIALPIETVQQAAFAPDGTVVYKRLRVTATGPSTTVTIRDKDDPDLMTLEMPSFSVDGKFWVYGGFRFARTDDGALGPRQAVIVRNGFLEVVSPEARGREVHVKYATVSANGKSMAYVREEEAASVDTALPGRGSMNQADFQSRVVMNGIAGPRLESVRAIYLSPDGSRIAYSVLAGGEWQMVEDGKAGDAHEAQPRSIQFSADGRHLAYAVRRGGKWFAVLNREVLSEYELAMPQSAGMVGEKAPFVFDGDGTFRMLGVREGAVYSVVYRP